MTYTITLAGQDITKYVDQLSVVVTDTLGQGAGAGGSGATQGRATTAKFNTSLGPANKAIGAGQAIPPSGNFTTSQFVPRTFGGTLTGRPVINYTLFPSLVRQGEIIITDAGGTIIFGGYATKLTDTSTSVLGNTKQNFTAVEGIDYSTSLQRTLVNEVFTAQTDIQIISAIITKYAPWVKLTFLPTSGAYTFPRKNFRNVTVEQVLQTISGVTGFLVYIDFMKFLHYVSPTSVSAAPFNLSDQPDFVLTFPHNVAEFLVDDNSIINRVLFHGGTKVSNNFTQDVSMLANGNNKTFPLAYHPLVQTDGKYHVTLNGVEQVVGVANESDPANTCISAGGLAKVLIDQSSDIATFDVAPAGGVTVLVKYRYNFPLALVLTDEGSHTFFGAYFDGSIDDSTIFDLTTAVQRCKVLLSQQAYGLTTLKVDTYKAGIQAGMSIRITNALRGIDGTYLVQSVEVAPYGGGNFVFHLTLGAWDWNLMDFLMKLPTLATFQDSTTDEVTEFITILSVLVQVKVSTAWTTKAVGNGPYYARAAALGDNHDAFPGFATIST